MWDLSFLLTNRFSVTVLWIAGFFVVSYILKWLFIKKGKLLVKFIFSLIISIGEGIKKNPSISSFFSRHPSLASFLHKRFDRKRFDGLMLTVLALLLIYTVISLVAIIVDVFSVGNVINVDLSLANLLHAFRNPLLVKIFLWITILGKWQIVSAVAVVVAALFWLGNKKDYIIPFFVSICGSTVFSTLGKHIWHRPRPLDVAVYIEKSWSFPSGHAALSMALYGFLVYFFWKQFKRWNKKINALSFGFLMIVLIGFSRLYLDVHYLSDVWAGYLVGFFWLTIGIGLVEYKSNGSISLEFETEISGETVPDDAQRNKTKYFKIVVVGSICLLVIIYILFGLKFKPLFTYAGEDVEPKQVDITKVDTFFLDHKLARFTETILGNPQEPFSFIVVAENDDGLVKSFKQAGWFLADSINFSSLVKALKFEILNKPYPTAPVTPYFWQTYTHDFSFEQPTEANSARYRHHARFWRTGFVTASGQRVYFGITSLDTGVKWWGVTHRINPNIDSEREGLFADFVRAGVVRTNEKLQFVDPVLGKNFTGDQFFTDGKVYIIYLK